MLVGQVQQERAAALGGEPRGGRPQSGQRRAESRQGDPYLHLLQLAVFAYALEPRAPGFGDQVEGGVQRAAGGRVHAAVRAA